MSLSPPRNLPSLRLPAALVHFWPAAGDDTRARQTTAAYASKGGVVQLGERWFAILPENGRESVFDDAITLCQAVSAHLRKIGAEDEISGFLVSPGELEVTGERIEALPDDLLGDLEKHSPRFKSPGIYFTGYAANWLRGRFQFDSAGLYDGPSGRRVPIHRLVGEAPQLGPWHNPEILGRQVKVPRPEVRAGLEAAKGGLLRVLGPLGSGKSHAVWHFLLEQEGPKLWFRIGRSLFGHAILARRLVTELHRLAPESLPPGGEELRQPQDLPPVRTAELLSAWLDNACRQLGATLWIVCDVVQNAVEADLDLLANLLARRGSIFRMLLLKRSGGPMISQLADLPKLEIPPMSEEEFHALAKKLFANLSLDGQVEKRMLEAAAGSPFALEEGLTDLIHRGYVRRVYGSFFYGGGSDVLYQPSRRLVRYVAAEVERLGEPLPLRILAAADQAVPVEHLESAAEAFGVELPPAWENAFLAAGWLREEASPWGQGLTWSVPAHGQALLDTVAETSTEELRQALGKAMVATAAPAELNWQTYQLVAGSADALPSLLHLSGKADTPEAREDIYQALERELRLLRSREEDSITELDLLFKLLPLGHRLGKLDALEDELDRALELAAGDPGRFMGLAVIKAEHDQDCGRGRQAIKGLEAALMASEGSAPARRALLLVQLGKLLERQDRLPPARKLFESLLEIVDRTQSTSLGAICHFHLGQIALEERDFDLAERHQSITLEVRRQQEKVEPRGLAAALSARGAIAFERGNYPAALDHGRQAEETLGETDDDLERSVVLTVIGRALGALGEAPAATTSLRRALALREGRGDVRAEEISRLHYAANQLDVGHFDRALQLARLAHFRLCLLPIHPALGDAEQLVGQILFNMKHFDEARDRFRDALRVHNRCRRNAKAALDLSWLLAIALETQDMAAILNLSAELETVAESLEHPIQGELLYYRLFRAFSFMRSRQTASRDPLEYLRRGHRELMQKLGHLEPKKRHQFLFQVRAHQELLDAAVEHGISLPSFQASALVKDQPSRD